MRKSFSTQTVLGAAAASVWAGSLALAGTANTLTTGTTLVTPGNWSLGTTPTIANDAVIGAAYPTADTTLYVNSAADATTLTVNSLNVTNANTITIRNFLGTNTNTAALVLGGAGSSTNSVAPNTADLLYVGGTSTLAINSATINGSTGALTLSTAQSGIFDIAGTATIGAALTVATGTTLTANVAGTLNFGGGVNLAAGTTLVKSGAGTLFLNGGTNTTSLAGNLTINAGTVEYISAATAPSTTASVTLGGGTLLYSNSGNQYVVGNGRYNIALATGTTSSLGTRNTSTTGSRLINSFGTGGVIISGAGSINIVGSTVPSQSAVEYQTANTYTGATNVGAQQMLLFGTGTLGTNGSATSSLLNVSGGTIGVRNTHAAGQLVAGVTIGQGATTFETFTNVGGTVTASTTGAGTYALGPISRSGVAATADVFTSGVFSTTSTNPVGSNFVGSYLTAGNGTGFATIGAGGLITPFTAYSGASSDYSTAGSTTDFDATSGGTFTNSTVNSIRLAAASPVDVSSPALTVASGGILISNTVGANATSFSGGTLTTGSGELFLHQYNNVAGGATTINSAIVDNGTPLALVKTGPGTVILDGNNTFTGATYVNAGTLQVGNNDANGSINFTGPIVDNGTLQINRSDNVAISGPISGFGSVVKSGSGTLTLSNSANSVTGNIQVSQGVLAFANTLALNGNNTLGRVLIDDAATLRYTSGANFVLSKGLTLTGGSGTINTSGTGTLTVLGTVTPTAGGSGTLVKTGPGVLALSGANTYTGVLIAGGTLRLNSTGALGASGTTTAGGPIVNEIADGATLEFNAGTVAYTGARNFQIDGPTTTILANSGTTTLSTAAFISGTGTFNKGGAGTIYLNSESNTFSGSFVINAGRLGFNTNTTFGPGTKSITVNDAAVFAMDNVGTTGDTVDATRSVILAGTTANIETGTSETWTLAGVVSGTGVLNKTGNGTLSLTGANTYSGGTVARVGTLNGTTGAFGSGNLTISPTSAAAVSVTVNSANAIAATANVTVNNNVLALGTLNVTDTSTIGSLAGNGQVNLGSTLTVGGAASTTFSGVIGGTGSLTKTGASTLSLTGPNTYTGITTVNSTASTLSVKYTSAGVSAATPLLSGSGTDIRNGAVVFDYAGDSSPAATIRGILAGSFTAGSGVMTTGLIHSSTATATRGLGYADTGSTVIVKAALFGDADLDGGVSINDFNALAGNFGSASGKVWTDGDFDYDGGVSINDFNLLAGSFGQSLPATSEMWAGLLAFAAANNDLEAFTAITGVPEPTSLGLIAAGATLGLRRRRRAC